MKEKNTLYRDVLPEKYSLLWYEIESVLGRGSSGVTYLALDKNLQQQVAIKEYFPLEYSSRREDGHTLRATHGDHEEMFSWGLDRFIKEARILAKFKHPNIVRVLSVFEQNSTAYMVMEYEQGKELAQVYKDGKLSEKELLDIYLPILDGLKLVHEAGFIHRDIKPANVYIREDGSPVLIDFGAARKVTGVAKAQQLTSIVTYGYAPFEQYNEGEEKQGPWTDIYALGASLYLAVIGTLPVEAMVRGGSMLSKNIDSYKPASVVGAGGQYSPEFLRSIDHALMFYAEDRPQNVALWADMLSGRVDVPPLPEDMLDQGAVDENGATVIMPGRRTQRRSSVRMSAPPALEPTVEKNGSKKILIAGAGIVALVLIGVVVFFQEETVVSQQPEVVVPEVATPTVKEQENTRQRDIDSLLKSARLAFDNGDTILPLDSSEVYYYQRVLELDPTNIEARARLKDISFSYEKLARDSFERNNIEEADEHLRALAKANLMTPDAGRLLEKISDARGKSNQISILLRSGFANLEAGRLTTPADRNAISDFNNVLRLDPGNEEAQRGISSVLAKYTSMTKLRINSGKLEEAGNLIKKIRAIKPNYPELSSLSSSLSTKIKKRDRNQWLLSQAKKLYQAGSYVLPDKKNAYYYYQQVLKADPANTVAKKGIKETQQVVESRLTSYISKQNYLSAEELVLGVENITPKTAYAIKLRAALEREKPPSRPDIEIITDLVGKYKMAFESRNVGALRKMSEYRQGREQFIVQFFSQYLSFNLDVSDFRHIGKERKGLARISIKELVNINGSSVQPGPWGSFDIEVKLNDSNVWKVYW